MISFRFHVVSLTAVFLAIAIGVIVGTTYVDRAVVENLEHRIDTVSENLDERRAHLAPGRHLRDFVIFHAGMKMPEHLLNSGQKVQLDPALPHLDQRDFDRTGPE